jgi:hypothetical protein
MDIDENGQWAKYKRKPYPLAADSIRLSLLSGKCLIQHPSVMMRRTAIEKVGGYDPSMEGAEDYDLWLRLSRTMPIRNIDTVLLHYRRHSCQVSTEHNVKQKQARDKALVRAILLDVCSDQNISKLSMQSAYEAIDGIFGIVARIREGKPVTRLQWFILGSALSMGLIGEGNGFKRRLIRKLQVNQQDLSKVTFYFLFFYLRLMLLKSTTSRINSKAVASLLDRLPDQIRA